MRHWTLMSFTLPATSIAVVALLATSLPAAETGLDTLIRGIEQRYNRARTLSVDFTETYSVAGRRHRPESGTLVLRKPGRMRWTYNEPAGKLSSRTGKVPIYTRPPITGWSAPS